MAVLTALLRFFAFLYHGLFSLIMLALAALIILTDGVRSLHLTMLPWEDQHTVFHVLLFGGLFALISVILAIRGKLRFLFLIWAIVVPFYLVRGYFMGGYRFTPDEFKSVVYLVIGSLIALLGAISQLVRRKA